MGFSSWFLGDFVLLLLASVAVAALSLSFFVRQLGGEEGGRAGIYRLAGLAWPEGVKPREFSWLLVF